MIERIEETRLMEPDELQINALINSAFGGVFGSRSFHGQRHHVRLIIRDPQIIGHMALCYRAIRLNGQLINVIGLAEVATDPARRGEGIAARLLQAAIAESNATQAAFILLFGDARLYGAAGFKPVQHEMTYLRLVDAQTDALRTEPSDNLMVLPLGETQWTDGAPLDILGNAF